MHMFAQRRHSSPTIDHYCCSTTTSCPRSHQDWNGRAERFYTLGSYHTQNRDLESRQVMFIMCYRQYDYCCIEIPSPGMIQFE